MTNDERDKLIAEMHNDIKWIKGYIRDLNKFKLMVWGALIVALLSLITH